MMTDPLADMITRVRNALMMRKGEVCVPYSHLKESVLKILKQEGYLQDYNLLGEGIGKMLVITLKYTTDGRSPISALKKVSKPGRRFFCHYKDLTPFRYGIGIRVVSTSKGVLSDQEARKQKVGGEVLLEIW